jgi:Bacteriodetes cell division protein (FtsL-like)
MESTPATKENKKGLRKWINIRWIVRNVPFFLFLSGLAVIYIYNGHYADKTIRNINKASKQLKELEYEYKTLKSDVLFQSKQSELAKAVAPIGLKEMTSPAIVLQDTIINK